jgi:hypothetical protein
LKEHKDNQPKQKSDLDKQIEKLRTSVERGTTCPTDEKCEM